MEGFAMKSNTWGTWLRRPRMGRGDAPRRSFRPAVEALEDRVVPTAHHWTGAVNDKWSEQGNWGSGGTPLGDLDATIVFNSNEAVRKASTNDAGNFSARGIEFHGAGFTLSNSVANTTIKVGIDGI